MFWINCIYHHQLITFTIMNECFRATRPFLFLNRFFFFLQTSEDCLYLYIWTPLSANATTSFPVMLYIHGGNFVHMSADSLLFNAEELAYRGQVIVVTMDYRLGRHWLSSPYGYHGL
jgi:hypothetical protein